MSNTINETTSADEALRIYREKSEPVMVETEITCTECEGVKTVERCATVRPWSDDPYEYVRQMCPKCDGEGVLLREFCSACGKDENECQCFDEREAA